MRQFFPKNPKTSITLKTHFFFFGIFGIAPVVTRTSDLMPLLRNGVGFMGGAIAAYLIAQATVGRRLENNSES